MTDAVTAKLVRRFGGWAASWVAGLPERVGRLAVRWDLTVGEPFAEGASSVAYRVTTADGRGAVLKLSPDVPFLAEQAGVLRMFEASGRVPVVLAADAGAVLMTEVRPGTPVYQLDVPPTPAEFAALLAALHDVDVPAGLPRNLRQWTDEFTQRAMGRLAEPAVAAVLTRADFERALAERDRLLAGPAPVALLHGDLHLGNVLDGGDRLMAIDPKACPGDPCFDAVDYVTGGAGRDGVHHRLAGLAAAGVDAERVLAWCRAVLPVIVLPLLGRPDQRAAVAELLAL